MKYAEYKNSINKTTDKNQLKSILKNIENDFQNINGRQYENLRHIIIKKIYLS